MKEETKQKRAELRELSKMAAMLVKEGVADSINGGIEHIYRQQGHEKLNTYRGWQKEGFQVRKGSKALLLWGRPVNKDDKKEADPQPTAANADDEQANDFWPIAYVFSNQQVDPFKK